MLRAFTIRQIGLIDEATLELAGGLTVLTGETGAGKTMLMTALGLVLGARAEASQLAVGQHVAELSAEFVPSMTAELQVFLEEQGLELDEGRLLLRRQLTRNGESLTSRAWVNGTAVAISSLSTLGEMLVEHQTQHAATALLQPAMQREVFDGLAGAMAERGAVAAAWQGLRGAEGALKELLAKQDEAEKRQEVLQAWVEELDKLVPLEGEFETLMEQRQMVAQSAQVVEMLAGINEGLEQAVGALRNSSLQLDRMVGTTPELNGQAEVLTRILSELEDTTYGLARHQSGLEVPEMSLEQMDDRLHAYKGAARKHQTVPQLVHETWETLQKEQATLADLSGHIIAAEKALKAAQEAYDAAGAKLTAKRKAAAPKLVKTLTPHLHGLNLPHAVFAVEFPATAAGSFGSEDVMFMFSANTGQPLQPLGKVASGGELSRVLLALKAVTYGNQPEKTIVLDEADTGIGGATAAAVGAAMAELGHAHQVLTITHHPQVAAYATHHLKIAKLSTDKTTRTSVTILTPESRVEELARMLAGQQVTDEARKAAQNLLHQSQPRAAA